MIPGNTVHCVFGGLVALFSVPLALRMVPMNRFYGIRTAKAFSSEDNWYAINAYGGKLLLVYGLLVLAFGVWGQGFAPPPTSPWTALYVAGPLALVLVVLLVVNAYSRKLP